MSQFIYTRMPIDRTKMSFLLCLPMLLISLIYPVSAVYAVTEQQDLTPQGNLKVTLINGLSGSPVRYETIQLKRVISDEVYEHLQQKYTDEHGQVGFQVKELGTGVVYALFAKPYNGGWVKGPSIRQSGSLTFEVGMIPVTLVSGGDRLRLQDYLVSLKEVLPDGSTGWSRSAYSDASGQIIFDAPDLGGDRTYRLWAKSPIDGSWKQSGLISKRGGITFSVGTKTPNANQINDLSGAPLVDEKIVAVEGEISSDSDVVATLTTHGAAGNTTRRSVEVHTPSTELNAAQLINRITFGATPALLERIQRIEPEHFLQEQLHPESISDSALEQELNETFGDMRSAYDLQAWQLMRAVYSSRQLLEVMTLFWDNHFNTDIRKSRRVTWELAENEGFRENALGYFRDLLQVSATSPAMMKYLDNARSRKQAPNENYARELMELHTLGVDGGYTQTDVAEVARAFTGWGIRNGAFYFAHRRHDEGEKWVLGYTISSAGMAEGEQILDILAEHPATARFICTKLLRLLVDDNPQLSEVEECAMVFSDSGGHIGTVVEQILRSPAFNQPTAYHSKIKTPIEFYAGILRNFQAVPGERDLRKVLPMLGMPLFRNPVPTGWAETGEPWNSTSQLLQRLKLSTQVAYRGVNDRYTYIELEPLFRDRGITTAEGVVGYLFQLALGSDYSMLEWDNAMGALTRDGTVPFDIDDEDAEERLRQLLALVMSYPSYQLQ